MNDRQLEAFVAIADARSINRAARELQVSQQTLTYQLQSLEDELGYPLFIRTRQGVELTKEGTLFRPEAEQVLRLFDKAHSRSVERAGSEVLRVSLRSDAGPMILLEICKQFSVDHPEVELRLISTPLSQQYRDLRQGAFDITEYPDNDRVREPGLSFEKIIDSPTVCLVRRSSPLATRERITFGDLYDQKVSVKGRGGCRNADRLREFIRQNHPQIQVSDMSYDAAQITIGSLQDMVVIGPKAFIDHNINPVEQVEIPLDTDITVDVGLVYAGETPLPVVAKFIETAHRVKFE